MLLVLSPAKSLDWSVNRSIKQPTTMQFIKQSAELIKILRRYNVAELAQLMHLSDKLATLNVTRYQEWQALLDAPLSKPAITAFDGDVYAGFDAASLTARELAYAQKTVRILSGLYGILRPFDLMQAYRLEMGTRLENKKGKDLYAFWGEALAENLNEELAQHAAPSRYLIQLASDEYFKAVPLKVLNYPVIQPVFLEHKNGAYKIISFFAKRARGTMARYIVQNKIQKPELLKNFTDDGYRFIETKAGKGKVQQLIFMRG